MPAWKHISFLIIGCHVLNVDTDLLFYFCFLILLYPYCTSEDGLGYNVQLCNWSLLLTHTYIVFAEKSGRQNPTLCFVMAQQEKKKKKRLLHCLIVAIKYFGLEGTHITSVAILLAKASHLAKKAHLTSRGKKVYSYPVSWMKRIGILANSANDYHTF